MSIPHPSTIIVLDDHKNWQELILELLSNLPEASSFEIRGFSNDLEATNYVQERSNSIAAYIQDLNRDVNSDRLQGITFFNEVIDHLTPWAKTLVVSAFLNDSIVSDLRRMAPERINFLPKVDFDINDFSERVRWLLDPLPRDIEQEGTVAGTDLIQLVELIATPWRDIRREIANHPVLLHSISPRMFEKLVAELFKDYGWDVELTARTRDGGYDIIAVRRSVPSDLRILVEAKRYNPENTVGIEIVRSLYGVKTLQEASQVVLATSSFVSTYAKKEFSRVIPWELDFLERDKILEWCKQYESITIDGSFPNRLES